MGICPTCAHYAPPLIAVTVGAHPSLADHARDEQLVRTELPRLWFGQESYFVDVVHPSARGHALIAEALVDILTEMRWRPHETHEPAV